MIDETGLDARGCLHILERLWLPSFTFAREIVLRDMFVEHHAVESFGIEVTTA